MGATHPCTCIARTPWVVLAAFFCSLSCSAGSGGPGTTSVAVASDETPSTMPAAPVVDDPNDAPVSPAPSDLPIVSTPKLPGNVPIGSVWLNPAPEILFDVTGPVATNVFYNQLGSPSLANDLAAIAQANPNFISDHITLIGRSLANRRVYNVTLYDPATALPFVVPVDDLLLASQQRELLDGVPTARDRLSLVIWPALYNKALALYLGGYDANFSNSIALLTGRAYSPIQNVRHQSGPVIGPIVNKINASIPVVMSSLVVSEGQAVTGVSPDAPNVTLLQAGYTFGCTNTQGLRGSIQICLQANTAHYILSYADADVCVRATTPHTAGAAYDGKYGYRVDGATVMPLSVFIALTDQVTALAQPLPE